MKAGRVSVREGTEGAYGPGDASSSSRAKAAGAASSSERYMLTKASFTIL